MDDSNKPEYRIRVIIEDVNVGEEVCQAQGPIYSTDEDTIAPVYDALNAFRNKYKEEFESIHYPKDEE